MLDGAKSDSDKLAALKAAIEAHKKYTVEVGGLDVFSLRPFKYGKRRRNYSALAAT